MGDPRGIGPEIIVKTLADPELRQRARFVIYGLNDILTLEADELGVDPYWYRIDRASTRLDRPVTEHVVVRDDSQFEGILSAARKATKQGGLASKTFVEDAIADAMRPIEHPRHVDAIVTGPINKHAWSLAGFKWPGHTELLQHRTRSKRSVMAFTSPRLRVALATNHEPINALRDVLTIGRVFDPIDLGHQALLDLGIEEPRIAVAGLNPHAGESGQFGDEERRLIEPAMEMARQQGIDVAGPFPADTVFIDAARGRYDLVVAMYHDQGLIPIKLLARDEAVNWTLGLPIIRTSPDHGTAYDIAGKGRANEGSMRAAVELAVELAERRVAKQAASVTTS